MLNHPRASAAPKEEFVTKKRWQLRVPGQPETVLASVLSALREMGAKHASFDASVIRADTPRSLQPRYQAGQWTVEMDSVGENETMLAVTIEQRNTRDDRLIRELSKRLPQPVDVREHHEIER